MLAAPATLHCKCIACLRHEAATSFCTYVPKINHMMVFPHTPRYFSVFNLHGPKLNLTHTPGYSRIHAHSVHFLRAHLNHCPSGGGHRGCCCILGGADRVRELPQGGWSEHSLCSSNFTPMRECPRESWPAWTAPCPGKTLLALFHALVFAGASRALCCIMLLAFLCPIVANLPTYCFSLCSFAITLASMLLVHTHVQSLHLESGVGFALGNEVENEDDEEDEDFVLSCQELFGMGFGPWGMQACVRCALCAVLSWHGRVEQECGSV